MSNKTTTTKNQTASTTSSLRQPSKIQIPTPFLTANNGATKIPSPRDSKEAKDEKDKTLNRTRSTTSTAKSTTNPPDHPTHPTSNETTPHPKQDPPQTTAEEKKENRRSIRLFGTLPRSYKANSKTTATTDANSTQAQSNGSSATTSKSTSKSSKTAESNNNNATTKSNDTSSKSQNTSESKDTKESTHTSVFSDIKKALTPKSSAPDSPQQEKQDNPDPPKPETPKGRASRSSTVEDVENGEDTPKSRRKTKKEKKEREAMQSQITELRELVDKLSTKVTELSTTVDTEVNKRKLLEESYVKLKVSFEQFKLEQYNKSSGNMGGGVKLNALTTQTEEQQFNQWTRKYSVDNSSSESSKSGGTIGKKGLRNSLAMSLKRTMTSDKEKDKEKEKESGSVKIEDTDEERIASYSSKSSSLDSKNMSIEAIAKADLIKEQLGNKYSSFASLRRRQIEQLETRKRTPGSPVTDTRRRSMSLDGTARLPSDSSSDEFLKSELRRSKEFIEVSKLLNNRSDKNVLVQKGILSNNIFGVPIESMQVERDVPVFMMNALSFIESKLDEYTVEEMFESSFPQETIEAARRLVEAGNIEFANNNGSKLNLNQNQNNITDPRVVAELLKLFFRKLPDALIPFKAYKYFTQWNEIDDNDEYKTNTMRSLIFFVPASNRAVLHFLTNFIYRVCIYNDITDAEKIDGRDSVNSTQPHFMNTLATLANVFGPLLLRAPPMSVKSEDYLKQLEKQLSATSSPTLKREPDSSKLQFEEERAGINLIRYLVMNHAVFQDEPEVQYTMQQGKRLVSACSIPKIFVKLMDEYYNESDPHFTEVVLLTYMYHVKADNLLEFLFQHCKTQDQPWRMRLKVRAMRILKQWIASYSTLLASDKSFVDKFKSFVETTPSAKEETVFSKFIQHVGDGETENAGTDTGSLVGKEFPYDSVDLMEIANHIHKIDFEFLCAIKPQEFLDKAFGYPERSPNFHKMAEQWNKRTLWVVTEILKRDKPSKRANCIDFFIKISHILRNLNDFHSSYAIIVALNHSTISRLKKSWDKVSKKTMAVYQNLLELFDMSYNFKHYRAALSATHGSYAIIPYIGLLPKDLTSLEEIPNKTEEGLVNFAKMRKLWTAIGQLRQYQQNKYIIGINELNTDLYEALKNPKVFTDKEMREISELHEPSQRRTPVDSPIKAPLANSPSTSSSQSGPSPNTSNSSLVSRGTGASNNNRWSTARPAHGPGEQPKGILSSIDRSDTDHSIHTHELNDQHVGLRNSYNSFTETNEENENYATTIEVSEPETSEMEELPSSRVKRVNFEVSSVKDEDSYVAEDTTEDFSSSDDDDDFSQEFSALSSRLPPAAANALTEISRVSFSPDSVSVYPFPTSSKISPSQSPYGKPFIKPMMNETFSPPPITRSRSASMSAKEKADLIKDVFSSKYGNIATLRKGQREQLSLGRKGRNEVLKRGKLDDVFWQMKARSQSDVSSDEEEFDNANF